MREIRILIVDDEPISSLLGRMLQLVGYDVEEVASGEAALIHLEEDLYDLMILDLQLPGIGGKEVIRLVRRRWPNLLIIVLTGYASLDSAVLALRSQVVDYLQKPITFEEVLDAVVGALAKHEARQQKMDLMEMMEKYPDLLSASENLPSSPHFEKRQPDTLFVEPLFLNRSERSARYMGKPDKVIMLTKGEMAVLTVLMSYPDQVISCQQLVQGAWAYETDADSAKSIIRPYISRLRKKLKIDSDSPKLIHTERNKGYMYASDPS